MPGTKYNQIINVPIKQPKSVSDAQWAVAVQLYHKSKEMGDKYPELTVAQAALETGWFKSLAGDFNYFGQKAGKGQQSVALKTKEQGKDGLYSTTASFRSYDSLEESLQDRLKKWGSKYKDAKNANEALDIVVKNGYATARDYKSSVGSILNNITGGSSTVNQQVEQPTKEEAPAPTYMSPTLIASAASLQSSMTPYEEPVEVKETAEVQAAKQDIAEKNFVQDLGSILSSQPVAPVVPQQQQDIPLDDTAYNYINIEEYQRGGRYSERTQNTKVADNTRIDFPIPVSDLKDDDVLKFTKDYLQSDMYVQRLQGQGYENPQQEREARLNNLKSVRISKNENLPMGSHYDYKKHVVRMDTARDRDFGEGIRGNSVLAHELAHVELSDENREGIPRLNNQDYDELFTRLKDFDKIKDRDYKDLPHDYKPDEMKADLNAIRYQLFKNNIYDTKKGEFTKEHLNKLKQSSNFSKDRLLRNYKEEDLIWLMNNIASTTNIENNLV